MSQSFPFPVLSPDCMDYVAGAEYSATLSYRKDAGIVLFHKVTDNTLVSELVSQQMAKFACYVSRPQSMFRKLFVHDDGKGLEERQTIAPPDPHFAEALEGSLFRPVVIATEPFNKTTSPHYGLDRDCWDSGDVVIPRGGIIAFDHWKRLKNSSSSIFQIKPLDSLSGGKMTVEVSAENGFEFLTYVSREMYGAIRSASSDKDHVNSILTHALSRGFEMLAQNEEYKENRGNHLNLSLLEMVFRAKGIPHWSEDNFKPEKAATSLHPHRMANSKKEEDDHE